MHKEDDLWHIIRVLHNSLVYMYQVWCRNFSTANRPIITDSCSIGHKSAGLHIFGTRMIDNMEFPGLNFTNNNTMDQDLFLHTLSRWKPVDTTQDLILGVVVLVLAILFTFACCVTLAAKCSRESRVQYQHSGHGHPSRGKYAGCDTNVPPANV